MLILTRKIGESIMIGDDIKLNVLSVRGGQVRLGFHAPQDVPVHREEIYFRILREKQSGNFVNSHTNPAWEFPDGNRA